MIYAGIVGEQTDTLAGNEVCRIREQHFDAGPDLGGNR
jgi:hypothetical protein